MRSPSIGTIASSVALSLLAAIGFAACQDTASPPAADGFDLREPDAATIDADAAGSGEQADADSPPTVRSPRPAANCDELRGHLIDVWTEHILQQLYGHPDGSDNGPSADERPEATSEEDVVPTTVAPALPDVDLPRTVVSTQNHLWLFGEKRRVSIELNPKDLQIGTRATRDDEPKAGFRDVIIAGDGLVRRNAPHGFAAPAINYARRYTFGSSLRYFATGPDGRSKLKAQRSSVIGHGLMRQVSSNVLLFGELPLSHTTRQTRQALGDGDLGAAGRHLPELAEDAGPEERARARREARTTVLDWVADQLKDEHPRTFFPNSDPAGNFECSDVYLTPEVHEPAVVAIANWDPTVDTVDYRYVLAGDAETDARGGRLAVATTGGRDADANAEPAQLHLFDYSADSETMLTHRGTTDLSGEPVKVSVAADRVAVTTRSPDSPLNSVEVLRSTSGGEVEAARFPQVASPSARVEEASYSAEGGVAYTDGIGVFQRALNPGDEETRWVTGLLDLQGAWPPTRHNILDRPRAGWVRFHRLTSSSGLLSHANSGRERNRQKLSINWSDETVENASTDIPDRELFPSQWLETGGGVGTFPLQSSYIDRSHGLAFLPSQTPGHRLQNRNRRALTLTVLRRDESAMNYLGRLDPWALLHGECDCRPEAPNWLDAPAGPVIIPDGDHFYLVSRYGVTSHRFDAPTKVVDHLVFEEK